MPDSGVSAPEQGATLLLQGKVHPDWIIGQPVPISVEYDPEDEGYIVSDDIFSVYGSGNTPGEAFGDYIISLIDYYELMAKRQNGDPADKAVFRRLELYLRPASK